MAPLKKHSEVLQKKGILENAREILKQEFVGIDKVVDEIINLITSWYIFPEIQEKPLIVNLWGLTGVGKTSVIRRLSELIDYDKKFYRFDLGDKDGRSWKIQNILEEIYEMENGYPTIIALDEFQHARTLDNLGMEKDNVSSRVIWDLLDSGKFQISSYNYRSSDLYDYIKKLEQMLYKNVVVKKGIVVENKKYFAEKMEINNRYNKQEDVDGAVYFVDSGYYDLILSMARETFETEFHVKEHLETLNGRESVEFLRQILAQTMSPKTVDCSKSLVFVLGNLDEAFSMTKNFNPDLNADDFHEESLKISPNDIKEALKRRFRSEQIARLGNNHVIYPAFSSDSFRKIIRLELNKISAKVYKHYKQRITIDPSVEEMIYNEGVFPTQGTRPVFSTIENILVTKLGKIFSEMLLKNIKPSKIHIRAEEDEVIIDYYSKSGLVHTVKEKQNLNLEKRRKSRKDDLQAITAVHESGHAIISALLLKTIPDLIFSVTADVGSGGFVYSKVNRDFISKKEIINYLALNLGGYAAEKIIFGKENLTTGSGNDLQKATSFICSMLRSSGMSVVPAVYSVEDFRSTEFIFDTSGELNAEAKKYIQEALELAELTLLREKRLLLKMALHLADNRSLTKEQMMDMMKEHLLYFNVEQIIKESTESFYRNHLLKLSESEGAQGKKDAVIDQQLKSMNLILNQENKKQ
jgi:hypothetical protein